MKDIITEDIKRINELIKLTEEGNVGDYIDSTYLKTSEQAGISDEDTSRLISKTIKDAIDHNMKLVMIRPEFVTLADQMIKEYDSNLLVGTVIDFPNGDGSVSGKMDEAILERLFKLYKTDNIPENIMPMTISWLGNSSVATLPTLLDLLQKGKIENHNRLQSGDIVVFASVGAGMNINSMIYRMP